MNNIDSLIQAIEKSNKILVVSHVNPDGDTLSCNLAMIKVLEEHFGKKATPVYAGKLPEVYSFLPGYKEFVKSDTLDQNEIYDLVIAIDVAAKDRMIEATQVFDKAKINVNIDHHKTNTNYGQLNFVDGEACAAGQVLFEILSEMKVKISKDVATLLYTAILTDTGCFKYEHTTVKTFLTAAKLVEQGASPSEIARACYDSKPQNMVQFQVAAMSKAVFEEDGKIAYSIITRDDMKRFNASDDHTDGISEALRQIKTVEVSMLLKETENLQTKVSLRSKSVDVSKIAQIFNGGGHSLAAGCTIKKPPQVAVNKILDYVRKEL